MQVNITPEDFVAAFRRDWPHQYEITTLRLVTEAQARRIAELEAPTSSAGPQASP